MEIDWTAVVTIALAIFLGRSAHSALGLALVAFLGSLNRRGDRPEP